MAEKTFDITKIDKYMQIQKADETGLFWRDACAEPFKTEGLYWFKENKCFERIPKDKLEGLRPGLIELAKCTAGVQLRFKSNTSRICLAISVPPCAPSALMSPVGQKGFDLYVDGVYWSCVQQTDTSSPFVFAIYKSDNFQMHEFTLNFPLYNGVNWLKIGLDEKAILDKPSPRAIKKPIVIYGTSITQGGAASRPGMAFTNIISRKLNVEILNFGFSGNGQNDLKIAEILSEIENPAMIIIDSEANSLSVKAINERVPRFLEILRQKHPCVPILVISKVKYGPRYAAECPVFKEEFKRIVAERIQAGDSNIHFLDGSDFFGPEDEFFDCTTDSAHPNDLGFFRMAKAIIPVIKKLLIGINL